MTCSSSLPLNLIGTLIQGPPGTVNSEKALLIYPTFPEATKAAKVLKNNQQVEVSVDSSRDNRRTRYNVSEGLLVFAGYPSGMNMKAYVPTPLDFGADPYGIEPSDQAMTDFWTYIKSRLINMYPTTLPFCIEKYTIPAGAYKITKSINWTSLRAWNVQIDADGALFISQVTNYPIIDNLDCRGVHVKGLSILSPPDLSPDSGMLIGPKNKDTCGNNKFTDVKILGVFTIGPMHNIGSETTRHDMSYFMNQKGHALVADGLNAFGARSLYAPIRNPGEAVSFTNNMFASCRFENSDRTPSKKDPVFAEGTSGFEFDKACYFLSFTGAGIQIRDLVGTYRTNNMKLAGLFESHFAPGLQYCVRFVMNDGKDTAISNFVADFQRSHAKTAIIRVETPDGQLLTSGSFNFRNADIRHDEVAYGATKMFDGSRITFIGKITCRTGAVVNVNDLLYGYGQIFVDDIRNIPLTPSNSQIAFDVYGQGSLSGTGMQNMLANGTGVGFQGGTVPTIRPVGPNADHDLILQGKGTGAVRLGTWTASGDAAMNGYLTFKAQDGRSVKVPTIP